MSFAYASRSSGPGRSPRRAGLALLTLLLLAGCHREEARLREAFPQQASEVLSGAGFERRDGAWVRKPPAPGADTLPLRQRSAGFTARLPASGADAITFEVEGVTLRLRERGVRGSAYLAGAALAYARVNGDSWWSARDDGALEQWVRVDDAGAGPVAEWDLEGCSVAVSDGRAVLLDEQGLPRLRVTAPAAIAPDGRQGRAWLEGKGTRLALYTDLRGPALVDPVYNTLSTAPSAHVDGATVQLPNGKLLVIGGHSIWSEVYDLNTDKWGMTAALPNIDTLGTQRDLWGHSAVALSDGRVVVIGGAYSTAASKKMNDVVLYYSPATNNWSKGGALPTARVYPSVTELPGGRIAVVGGYTGVFGQADTYPTAIDILTVGATPATDSWHVDGNLPTNQGRYGHTSVLLQNGKIWVAGGVRDTANALSNSYLLTPGTATALGSVAAGPALTSARAFHSATMMADGKVLVAGGLSQTPSTYVAKGEIYDPTAGTTTQTTGSLNNPRAYHAATLLPSGKVLIADGTWNVVATQYVTEEYDPATGLFTGTAPSVAAQVQRKIALGIPHSMAAITSGASNSRYDPRPDLTASDAGVDPTVGSVILPLSSGKAWQSGRTWDPVTETWSSYSGYGWMSNYLGAVHTGAGKIVVVKTDKTWLSYDLRTSSWTYETSQMQIAHGDYSCVVALPTGHVLVASGAQRPEKLDLSTKTWSYAASMVKPLRAYHSCTLLADGRVLAAGSNDTATGNTTEIYDPWLDTWTAGPNLAVGRYDHTATLLPNGNVIFIGGLAAGWIGTTFSGGGFAELYVASSNSMGTVGGASMDGNYQGGRGAATLLPSGRVVYVGGVALSPTLNYTAQDWVVTYDPVEGISARKPILSIGRFDHAVGVVGNGKVIVVGGSTRTNGSTPVQVTIDDLIDDGTGPRPAWAPEVTEWPSVVRTSGTMTFKGLRFRGKTEGSSGGAHGTTAPLPMVRFAAPAGAPVFWGELQSLTSDNPADFFDETATHTLTVKLPSTALWNTPYLATVFVNGVPSDTHLILPPPTMTTMSVSFLPSAPIYSEPTSFKATLSNTSATGTVTFFINNTQFGNPVPVVNGVATTDQTGTNGLPIPVHGVQTVKAVYSGDDTYGPTQARKTYDPIQADLDVTLDISPATAWAGSPVTFTVTAGPRPPARAVPTSGFSRIILGYDWPAECNYIPMTVTPTGITSTCTTSSVTGGTQSIRTLVEPGIGFKQGGATVSYTVQTAATSLALSASPAAPNEGEPITLTANVTSTGTLGGTVTFKDGTTTLCADVAVAANSATCAVSTLTMGSHSLSAVFSGDGTYTSSTGTLTLSVGKPRATVTVDPTSLTVAYDGQPHAVRFTTTPAGVATTVNYSNPSGYNSSTAPTAAGYYYVSISVTDPAYQGSAMATLMINAAPQVITFNPPQDKAYGDPPFDLAPFATGGGSGNPITFQVLGGPGTLSGSVLTLTARGTVTVRASQAAGGNYAAATPVDANIPSGLPRAQMTWDTGTLAQTYDGTAHAVVATTVPAGLTVQYTYDGASTAPTNAGSYAVVATVVDMNYGGRLTGTLVVAKAATTITWANPTAIQYGTALSLNEYAASGSVPGSFTYTPALGTLLNAGTHTLQADFTPTDSTNYAAATKTVSLTVRKRRDMIIVPPVSVTYGVPDFKVGAFAVSGAPVRYGPSSNSAVATVAPDGTVHVVGPGVATFAVNPASADSNFDTYFLSSGSIEVSAAPLYIRAKDAQRAVGDPNPAFEVTYAGWVNGDGPSLISGTPSFSTAATQASPAGDYSITPGLGTLQIPSKYTPYFTGSVLAVGLKSQTIHVDPLPTMRVGDAPVRLSFTGGASGNPVNASDMNANGLTVNGMFTPMRAGIAIINLSQNGDAQYARAEATAFVRIEPAPLLVRVNHVKVAVGASPATYSLSYEGLIGTDTAQTIASATLYATSFTGNTDYATRGTYPVRWDGMINLPTRYRPYVIPGVLAVGQELPRASLDAIAPARWGDAPLTLTTANQDGDAPTLDLPGGVATLSGSTATLTATGNAPVLARVPAAAGFATPLLSRMLTVRQAPLTVAPQNATVEVGATAPACSVTYTGFVNGEDAGVLLGAPEPVCSVPNGTPAGVYPLYVEPGNLWAANYALTFASASLTVTKRSQGLAFELPDAGVYGQADLDLAAATTPGASGNPVSYVVTSGPATLSGTQLHVTGAGTVVVTASQLGDATYRDESVSETIEVAKASASVSFVTSSLTQTYGGVARVASATTTPAGLTVALTYDGTSTAPVHAGIYAVRAVIDDANYAGEASDSLVVNRAPQVISFSPPASAIWGDAPIDLSTTATGGICPTPVTFSVVSGPGTLSGSTLTLTGAGSISLLASQAGSPDCDAAVDVAGSIAVGRRGNGETCTQDDMCLARVCGTDGRCGRPNGGTCDSASVCRSTVCVALDGKCGALGGTPCTTHATCRMNVCGGDGRCGVPNGGACTSGDACRSGSCSAGVCTTGCTASSDCGSGEWCVRGSCEPQLPNGSPCASSSTCLSGVCGTNGQCGVATPGACATAGECQSGACFSGACAPTCLADAECGAGKWCELGVCKPTLPSGSPCAASSQCTAGVCDTLAGLCGQPVGSPCTSPGDCQGGTCGTNLTCAATCVSDADCAAAAFCDAATHACVPVLQNSGGWCTRNAECASGFCAADLRCGAAAGEACASGALCRDGWCDPSDARCGVPAGGACSADGDCRAGLCATDGRCGAPGGVPCTAAADCRSGVCAADGLCGTPPGGTCTGASDCRDGACTGGRCGVPCTSSSQCVAGTFCANGTCEPALPAGSPCTSGAQCVGGVCGSDQKCGAGPSTACTLPTECRSGVCAGGACASQCVTDFDCAAGSWCDAGACRATKPSGQPCTRAAQCANGLCAPDGLCGLPDSAPCAGATDCRGGVCSVTGLCAASCTLDADCPASAYCDGTSGTCLALGPNGTPCSRAGQCAAGVCAADGKCGAPAGGGCGADSMCRDGVCNVADAKCGLPPGSPCASTAECRSGACAADGRCGAPGGAPCTAATDCRAQVCATDGLCGGLPGAPCSTPESCRGGICSAGSCATTCATSADCVTGTLCVAGSCQQKLANGDLCGSNDQCASGACGTDGRCGLLPPASCTSASSCRSGICSAARCASACVVDFDCGVGQQCLSGTCSAASPNGQPCTLASRCASGTCASDGLCGQPGGGSCSAPDQCRSGICAAGACATACTADAQCVAGTWCQISTGQCVAAGPNGVPCTAGGQCTSGLCGADQVCGAPVGTPCSTDGQCRNGVCGADARCGQPAGGPCSTASDCRDGLCGVDGACGAPTGAPCASSQTCRAGLCATDGRCGALPGEACTSPDQCRVGACVQGLCQASCTLTSQCPSNTFCAAGACTPRLVNGASCGAAEQCASGTCAPDGRCGTATGGACSAPETCRDGACTGGRCGSGCTSDYDCATGAFCAAGTCTAQLPPNAPCTRGSQCAGGACASDGRCGASAGAPCSDPSGCRSGACSVTGLCLAGCNSSAECAVGSWCDTTTHACRVVLVNGEACQANEQCGSGLCGTDGRCGQPAGTPCGDDGQCRDGLCNAADGRCGLPDGSPVPCAAASDCRSGVCSALDGRCGTPAGGPCASAQDCRAGVCAADGLCGAPVGSPCTSGDACRAGTCAAGQCATTCTSSAQCASGQWCSAGSCVAGVPAGQPCTASEQCLAGTCAADGRCGSTNGEVCTAPLACRSGACDLGRCSATCTSDSACAAGLTCRSGTCAPALPGGSPCAQPSECLSGVCASDGRCGAPAGEPCASPTDCRSGACGTSGRCVSTCTSSVECAARTFCDTANGSCTPLRPNASPCTADTQCASGACSVDGFCGALPGEPCAALNATVCRSQVCSPTDDRCGEPNGRPCLSATQCRSGVCEAGLCGAAPGNACDEDVDCREGACSPLDGRCGLPSGTPCTTSTACRGGTCGTDGLCGLPPGSPCTAADACRSGTCSAGLCAGACVVEADCATGTWCVAGACVPELPNDRLCSADAQCASGRCAPDGRCGAPTGGACTSAAQCRAGACSAGTCSTTCSADAECATGLICEAGACTAARPNGQPCDASRQCLTGLCAAADGQCGVPAGAPCVGAADCRSGICAANGLCAAACQADADCGAASWCDPVAHTCKPVSTNASSPCTSGAQCVSGVCAADGACGARDGEPCGSDAMCRGGQCDPATARCGLPAGERCLADAECRGGACSTLDGRCGEPGGAPCTGAVSCRAGVCASDGLCGVPEGGTCTTPESCRAGACHAGRCSATCATSAECPESAFCAAARCLPKLADGEPCASGEQCVDGVCAPDGRCGQVTGGSCTVADECRGLSCRASVCSASCATDFDCGDSAWCNAGTCTARAPAGEPCTSSIQCAGGVCAGDGHCGAPSGAPCAAASQCRDGVCSTSGTCRIDCSASSECSAGDWCAPSTHRCEPVLVDSATCTADEQCLSGACAADGRCGGVPGEPCGAAAMCRDGICAADGLCGQPAGAPCSAASECRAGTCSALDGLCGDPGGAPCASAQTCRAGLCATDGRCGSQPGGACTGPEQCRTGACHEGTCGSLCANDAECVAGSFCAAGACVPALPAGVPCAADAQCAGGRCGTDGLCGGVPTEACTAPAECRSGACSHGVCGTTCAADSECANGLFCESAACVPVRPAAATCARDAQCASGECAPDGQCGVPTGAPCSAAVDCRSGICSSGGACVASCASDAECAAGRFCSAGACAAVKDNGAACARAAECSSASCAPDGRCGALPGDACSNDDMCRDGLCRVSDGRCGLPAGERCTANAECRAGGCAALDLRCGQPGGTPCQADADCRAGLCSSDGRCGMPNGEACTTPEQCRGGICSSGSCAAACSAPADCGTGRTCAAGACVDAQPAGGACTAAADCVSGVCAEDGKCGAKAGATCSQPSACRDGACNAGTCGDSCAADLECAQGLFCQAGHCVAVKASGESCTRDAACQAGTCSADGKCGVPAGGACASASDCRSGICAADGRCAETCAADGECVAGGWCADTGACAPAQPSEETTTCMRDAQCASGICGDDGHCGAALNEACSSPKLCRVGICDPTNLECGFANARGECSAETAATVCQSGVCDQGLCGLPYGARCDDAAQCRSGSCNTVCLEPQSDAKPALAGGGCSSSGGAPMWGLFAAALVLLTRRRRGATLAALLLVVPAVTRAETLSGGFSVQQFDSSYAGDRFFAVPDADVRGDLRLAVRLTANYGYRPLTLVDARTGETLPQGVLIRHALYLHLDASFAIANRWLIDVGVPFAAFQSGDTLGPGIRTIVGASAADVRAGARMRLLGTTGDPFVLGLQADLWFPTGAVENYAGDEGLRGHPRVLASGVLGGGRWFYSASLGALLRPYRQLTVGEVGSALTYSASGGIALWDGRLLVGPELFGSTTLINGNTSLEVLAGARACLGPVSVGASLGAGLTRAPGTPTVRSLVTVSYDPSCKDLSHPAPAFVAGPKPPAVPVASATVATSAVADAPAPAPTPAEEPRALSDPATGGDAPAGTTSELVPASAAAPAAVTPPAEAPSPAAAEPPSSPAQPAAADGAAAASPALAVAAVATEPRADATAQPASAIPQVIAFAGGPPALLKEGELALAEVAALLRAHPELELVRVDGHADDQGPALANDYVSGVRARLVVQWLVSKGGIDAKRLEAKGWGSGQPRASNKTLEGRRLNRRVEFTVLRPAP